MLHAEHLKELNWPTTIGTREGRPLALVIPQAVVGELDRLKRSNGAMKIGGESVSQRSLARRALAVLTGAFPRNTTSHELGDATAGGRPLHLMLQLDDLSHQPLADTDAEIIDRALSLRPYGESLTLVTGDASMRFRAEHAGLRATSPHWADDDDI